MKYFNGMIYKIEIDPIENGLLLKIHRFHEDGEIVSAALFCEDYPDALSMLASQWPVKIKKCELHDDHMWERCHPRAPEGWWWRCTYCSVKTREPSENRTDEPPPNVLLGLCDHNWIKQTGGALRWRCSKCGSTYWPEVKAACKHEWVMYDEQDPIFWNCAVCGAETTKRPG